MLFLGITGGVGAGKSELLRYLKENFSCRIIESDRLAQELMEPGNICYNPLCRLFADADIYQADRSFDRPKLAALLFREDEKRAALNAIVHPAVGEEIRRIAQEERKSGRTDLLVLEAALLIEEGYDRVCDELWYVYSSEENRRARLLAARGYSPEKTASIMQAQLGEAEFRKACTHTIDNDGSIEDSCRQMNGILAGHGIYPLKDLKR